MNCVLPKTLNLPLKNSRDNQTTIISLETDRPEFKGPAPKRDDAAQNLITSLKFIDPKMDDLLDRANKTMLDQDYTRVVQIFMRIRDQGNAEIQPPIQELIGLTREYLGQNAHARAEYELYLQKYPEGEAAPRIRQRLNTLITASNQPVKSSATPNNPTPNAWRTQTYGGFGQQYYYDTYTTPSIQNRVLRSALNNQLDMSARADNAHYDLRAQFSGIYQKDFEYGGDQDVTNLHRVTIEGRQKDYGIFARVGRQSRSSGGVLGRFDGLHAAYELNSTITLNTVMGYPVDALNKEYINTDQQFYGASVDVGTLWDGWDFSGFYIRQDYLNIKDREALGGEARYFDTNKTLFASVDYDVFFDQLNMVMVNGRYAFNEATAVTASYDYRSNPILISTGALQLQNGTHTLNNTYAQYFEELFYRYTLEEVYALVASTLYDYQTLNLGLSHQFNKLWQIDTDLNASKYSGTSGSALPNLPLQPSIEGTGWDIYYSARATLNEFFHKRDSLITQVRFSDTSRATGTTVQLNWRIQRWQDWRINPKLRFDYRVTNNTSNNAAYSNESTRMNVSPSLGVSYRLKRNINLQLDAGYNQYTDEIGPITYDSSGYFLQAGYRVMF